ncbi:MAG TPA: holo-ACP synthase [Gemmatimonadales bacterium]|nr:holo-ACP synthase [Gemmatimonadales bacterium]
MILGIGLDVVETAKVEQLLAESDQRFEERVFTPDERRDCVGRADRAEALAARFAAKEACFKALGTGWSQGVSFLQVEVRRPDGGAPMLALSGEAAARAQARGVKRVHVSLSHSAGVAAAAVILEG